MHITIALPEKQKLAVHQPCFYGDTVFLILPLIIIIMIYPPLCETDGISLSSKRDIILFVNYAGNVKIKKTDRFVLIDLLFMNSNKVSRKCILRSICLFLVQIVSLDILRQTNNTLQPPSPHTHVILYTQYRVRTESSPDLRKSTKDIAKQSQWSYTAQVSTLSRSNSSCRRRTRIFAFPSPK